MPPASNTFRVFVSSTFSDLKKERNALQDRVFPKLRELCMQHGCRFQAIDLRWGVREEAALDQQTMNICLQELERCRSVTPRPNFVLLLGDRYGWRPLPPQVEAQEFEEILEKVSPEDKGLLLWDERQPDSGKGRYRKDENAVPAEYYLRPRQVEIPDNATDKDERDTLDKEAKEWEQTEKKLRGIILRALEQLGWPEDDPGRTKYEASATHQEILHGALRVRDAHEHVYCFLRKIEGLPQEASAKDFIDLDETGYLDEEARKRLEIIKQSLRHHLPDNIFEYKARWTGSGITADHLDGLCDDVYNSLSRIILEEIAQLEEADPVDKEITDHDTFGRERAKFFIGRTDVLQRISDYVKESDNHPLTIFGESGSGKSALIAHAVQRTQESYPNAEVISRFIGATPSSSDGRALLESLCRQVSCCYGEDASTIPTEYRELVQELLKRLELATKRKPLILFLDALDQLSDNDYARNLSWLPTKLPENVHVVVSCLPSESLSVLQRRLPAQNLMELEPMPPEEGGTLLNLWLEDAGRTLQARQRHEVLSKFEQCRLPLYLKLAFEEARRWKSHTEKIKLSKDIPGVIRDLFERLSLDVNHGRMIVSHSLGYLVAAKSGLTEDELLDVLSEDEEVFQDFMKRARHEPPQKRLPVVVWSRLYFDLEPYLTERTADGTTLMTFYHRQFGEVVAEEFLAGETREKRHEGLAQYFGEQTLWLEKEGKKTANLRKVSELPYQQTYGELWDEVEQTLCDLHFIEAKCAAGMTYDLIHDYNNALDALPEAQPEKQKKLEHEARVKKYIEDLIAYAKGEIKHLDTIPSVEPWSDEKIRQDNERIINNPTRLDRIRAFSQFINSESHGLVKFAYHPGFVIQQAYNSGRSGPVVRAAESIVADARVGNILILLLPFQRPNYNSRPALLRTLEGHEEDVMSVSITPDGTRAISISEDETLKVWDMENGECLRTIQTCRGEDDSVSITADGKIAIYGSSDGTLQVWELDSGACLGIMEGHNNEVSGVSIAADGKKAISGSWDGTLRVWEVGSGACLKILKAYGYGVSSVGITPNGKMAVSGSESESMQGFDHALQVWDLESGKCLRTIKGQTSRISSVTITADGKKAVSGDWHGTIRVWDLENGKCLGTFMHGRGVDSVCVTADGKLAISGGSDRTLRLWNLDSGECLRIFKGHSDRVRSVSITADGREAVSGSEDRTLQVWNLENGQCLRTPEAHWGFITISMTADGKVAISKGSDGSVRMWDLDSGECLSMSEEEDGNMVRSAGVDEILRMFDLESGISTGTIHDQYGRSMTPDLRKMVLWLSGDLQVFDARRGGNPIQILKGHTDKIGGVSITADGKRAISGSQDGTVRAWELESGNCISVYPTRGRVSRISQITAITGGSRFACGTHSGEVIFLRVHNLPMGTPIVTPVRMQLLEEAQKADGDIKTKCPWCGKLFDVADKISDLIRAINHDAKLSPKLPDEAWDEPQLLSECPLCHKPLKFNPFIVDNKGRY